MNILTLYYIFKLYMNIINLNFHNANFVNQARGITTFLVSEKGVLRRDAFSGALVIRSRPLRKNQDNCSPHV